MYIKNEIDERVEVGHGASIAYFGSFNAERLGATVDAFGGGALVVDGVIERAVPSEQGAHESAFLPIEVFDTASAFGKLGVLTGLVSTLREEQRAAKALGTIAVVC